MPDDNEVGTLWLIATPIGNLGDLSPRAKETLSRLDLLACESLPAAKRLCSACTIPCPRLILYREDSGESSQDRILSALHQGLQCGLVSDAGAPGLSDPGWKLVAACHQQKLTVRSVAGPSSLTAALSVAGLPTRRFIFEGFPPHKRSERLTFFRELSRSPVTSVFFESPHNILETLETLGELCGASRLLCISRELTKLHESNDRRSLSDWRADPPTARGEFVLVLEGAPPIEEMDQTQDLQAQAQFLAARGLTAVDLREFLVKFSGATRNQAYRIALEKISQDLD